MEKSKRADEAFVTELKRESKEEKERVGDGTKGQREYLILLTGLVMVRPSPKKEEKDCVFERSIQDPSLRLLPGQSWLSRSQ